MSHRTGIDLRHQLENLRFHILTGGWHTDRATPTAESGVEVVAVARHRDSLLIFSAVGLVARLPADRTVIEYHMPIMDEIEEYRVLLRVEEYYSLEAPGLMTRTRLVERLAIRRAARQ